MKYPEETSLFEIIKHIKDATRSSEMPAGVPIYVDRTAIAAAGGSVDGAKVSIDLEGIPLRRTLQLALAQVELGYFVEDGLIYITHIDRSEDHMPPALPERTALSEKIEKAQRGELTLDEMKDLVTVLKYRADISAMRSAEGMVWGGVGPDPRIAAADAKENKELVETFLKLTQNLLEELKEARKSKQAEPTGAPVDPKAKRLQ